MASSSPNPGEGPSASSSSSSSPTPRSRPVEIDEHGIQPITSEAEAEAGDASAHEEGLVASPQEADIDNPVDAEAISAHGRLLESYNNSQEVCGSKDCNHGTFSPRPGTMNSSSTARSRHGFGGRYPGGIDGDGVGDNADAAHGVLGDAFTDGVYGGGRGPKKMSTTKWLAQRHGVKGTKMMYVVPSCLLCPTSMISVLLSRPILYHCRCHSAPRTQRPRFMYPD